MAQSKQRSLWGAPKLVSRCTGVAFQVLGASLGLMGIGGTAPTRTACMLRIASCSMAACGRAGVVVCGVASAAMAPGSFARCGDRFCGPCIVQVPWSYDQGFEVVVHQANGPAPGRFPQSHAVGWPKPPGVAKHCQRCWMDCIFALYLIAACAC